MIHQIFIRFIVNPIIWRYFRHSRRFRYLRNIRAQQWRSLDENRHIQQEQLFTLIQYATRHIPYYKEIAERQRIRFTRPSIFEDIQKFPILTKKDIRDNFDRLCNPSIPSQKNTSGGSTGEQAIFMQTHDMYDWDAAVTSLFNEWAGRREGEKMVKLWGSERDILQGGQGVKGFLVRGMMNEYLLNTFRLSDDDMQQYVDYINTHKPVIITAYVQSAYEIARYIQRTGQQIFHPKGIITSAGTLFPHFRELISTTFGCPVFNRYGSREVGAIACECEQHKGLHLNTFNHYVEILNGQLQPVRENGISGSVYITHLHNTAMPLIRYDIGDLATHSTAVCSCGRGMPLIQHVEGRAGSILRTKKAVIDSTALTTSFYYFSTIKQYQVIQRKDNFIIRVVLNSTVQWEREKAALTKKLHSILGDEADITFEIVPNIAATKSGKYLFIINENEI